MAGKKENISLEKGIKLQVGGEFGEKQNLSVDILSALSLSLQKLIHVIAVYESKAVSIIDPDLYKIELYEYRPQKSVLSFRYLLDPKIKGEEGSKKIKGEVDAHLTMLFRISQEGAFEKLKATYPEEKTRNEIVKPLKEFLSATGNTPMNIVEYGGGRNIKPLFELKKLENPVFKELVTHTKAPERDRKKGEMKLAYVSISDEKADEQSFEVQEVFSSEKHSIAYSPDVIESPSARYFLKYPLRCKMENDGGNILIESELLGLVGMGADLESSEKDFGENFDYAYFRYNQLDDNKLSSRLRFVKNLLNEIVIKVETIDG